MNITKNSLFVQSEGTLKAPEVKKVDSPTLSKKQLKA